MKKAVITTGSKQYLVGEGEVLVTELIKSESKKLTFAPLLVIDGEEIKIGNPEVKGSKVTADVVEAEQKAEKVSGVRFKAKKRVHKVHGHRQRQTVLRISSIL